jgi:hypothetical protein
VLYTTFGVIMLLLYNISKWLCNSLDDMSKHHLQHVPFNHQNCHHQLAHAPSCAASALPLPFIEHPSFVLYAFAQLLPQ